MLTTQLSEKLVSHVLKFIGGEIETTRHLGFYAKWSHCILMHHGLWIRRRWKDLLPILNQLHKSLTTKSQELSEVCDRNVQSIDFLLRMATVKKELKNAKKVEEEIQSDVSDDDEETKDEIMYSENDSMMLQSKWSDSEEEDD